MVCDACTLFLALGITEVLFAVFCLVSGAVAMSAANGV
jgi:hypothetical protein